MTYFSDKERGPRPRTEETITPALWGGIVAYIQSLISKGGFGYQFPEMCPDGLGPIGTDQNALSLAVEAEIPGIIWPLQAKQRDSEGFSWEPHAPDTFLALDLIEFCYRNVATPIQGSFHSFFQHHHLTFDVQAGREEFRTRINTIFSRNALAFELDTDGAIVRLAPPVLRETLMISVFRTSDHTLDQMLEEARRKFLNPVLSIRREAVERLWDAWERIKTLEQPNNKKLSIELLLHKAARELDFQRVLAEEARKLTEIGNTFHIRHAEITQTRISESEHLDYLFHRLFALIQLLLRKI